MKNKFKIGETVSFYSGLNAPELTKIIGFKWGEFSKCWLYKLERSPGVFFDEKSLSKIKQPKTQLKNEDIYSMQKIEKMQDEEDQINFEKQYFNR